MSQLHNKGLDHLLSVIDEPYEVPIQEESDKSFAQRQHEEIQGDMMEGERFDGLS